MSRRLDATTAEIVKTLQRYGYDVSFPIEIDLQEYQAKVTLTGNRHALVSKNDQGGWVMDSLGKPAFRDKAAEYSADLNQNGKYGGALLRFRLGRFRLDCLPMLPVVNVGTAATPLTPLSSCN